MMTLIDEEGVPALVQEWYYAPSLLFHVKLFNENWIVLDRDSIRHSECANYKRWDAEKDGIAINSFVNRNIDMFLKHENP